LIIRKLNELHNTENHIHSKGWDSVRLLLHVDKMGFSFHITTIHAHSELHIHYKNHLESVYCISGKGEIENKFDCEIYQIEAGTLYALNLHDQHILRAFDKPMIMACVFNPPLAGTEIHDETGSYPAID
jgi:L-ectoine synthase